MFCRKCRRVITLPIPEESIRELVAACPDIRVDNYFLSVFGLCSDCARQENL